MIAGSLVRALIREYLSFICSIKNAIKITSRKEIGVCNNSNPDVNLAIGKKRKLLSSPEKKRYETG